LKEEAHCVQEKGRSARCSDCTCRRRCDGRPKLLEKCVYPLTGLKCVTRIYTNLATIDVVDGKGFVVRDMAPGLTFDELQAKTAAKLHQAH
jgi:acyl CoA:acetate/3-ketoacid CoA transferase beta subunit